MSMLAKKEKRVKRQRRIRARMAGTSQRPRLALFRSNQHLFAQLIDDDKRVTLVSLSDIKKKYGKGLEGAKKFGEALALQAKDAKISKVVFDRRGYAYHGIIKAIAEAVRQGGLEF